MCIRDRVISRAFLSISVRITLQPETERATAVALPIPLAAPVMNAVLSFILADLVKLQIEGNFPNDTTTYNRHAWESTVSLIKDV